MAIIKCPKCPTDPQDSTKGTGKVRSDPIEVITEQGVKHTIRRLEPCWLCAGEGKIDKVS